MKRTSFWFGLIGAISLLGACDDSGGGNDGGAGGGGGGTGGVGGTGAAGGAGGDGGSGGGAEVNPLEGIGAVTEVKSGLQFGEGPQWIPGTGTLLFSDIPASAINELTPPGKVEVFVSPSGNTNGIGLDPGGFVFTCEHSGRRVARMAADKSTETLADSYMGMKLNSPNDVIARDDGNVYFSDPPYGLGDPSQSELGFFGVFRVTPAGDVVLVADDMQRPNGVVLSPDQSTLYVADTMKSEIRAYALSEDGSTGTPETFASTTGAGPDGMAIDELGNLYVTTTAGIEVHRPDGTYVGAIALPEKPTNCAFGGADRRTLYITGPSALYSVQMVVPGLY